MSAEDSFYKGFFYGATIGFIAGIIYAPKTGNETREILGENKVVEVVAHAAKILIDSWFDRST